MFFFFSSRRRHTRCSRDWSSDVCSSDLRRMQAAAISLITALQREVYNGRRSARSEERRVGKECKSRWSPYHFKKQTRQSLLPTFSVAHDEQDDRRGGQWVRLKINFQLFFFSSRRRHTRCSRDWSSDVCSSDLNAPEIPIDLVGAGKHQRHAHAL